jgi:hypothetical protein
MIRKAAASALPFASFLTIPEPVEEPIANVGPTFMSTD